MAMNPPACPCPVSGQVLCASLGAQERRATSPSIRSGGGPGDQGHLPPSPAALQCIHLLQYRLQLSLHLYSWLGSVQEQLPLCYPHAPPVPAGLFTQCPVEHRLKPIRPKQGPLRAEGAPCMLQQELAGWQVAVPMWIPWDCQQAQAAELKGVCKERNMMGGGSPECWTSAGA